MNQLSKIVGLDLISKSDLKICGVIKTALFDGFCKKIAYFVVEEKNESFLVPYGTVRAIKDAVVVNDLIETLPLKDVDITSFCEVLGKRIFTSAGDCRGSVKDILLDNKGKVAFLTTGEGEHLTSQIAGIGDFILIKDGTRKQKPKTAHMPKALYDTTVYALFDNPGTEETESFDETPSEIFLSEEVQPSRRATKVNGEPVPIKLSDALRGIELAQEEDHIPPRIICDYNFLLSRTLTSDLYSYNGELIAKKGMQVTVELVETVRRHGKLIDLTLSSK